MAVVLYVFIFGLWFIADATIAPRYERGNNRDHLQALCWVPLLIAAFAAPVERIDFYRRDAPEWCIVVAFLLEVSGATVGLISRSQLGRFGTPHLTVVHEQRVIRTGIYGYIRHPIYVALSLNLIGWSVLWAAPFTLLICGILFGAAIVRRVRIEEAMMLEAFGDDYRSYINETGRFLPRLRARQSA